MCELLRMQRTVCGGRLVAENLHRRVALYVSFDEV